MSEIYIQKNIHQVKSRDASELPDVNTNAPLANKSISLKGKKSVFWSTAADIHQVQRHGYSFLILTEHKHV